MVLSKYTIHATDKDFAYLKPTTLQTVVAHARRHPNDKIGWNALPKSVQDNFEECCKVVPQSWIVPLNSSFLRE